MTALYVWADLFLASIMVSTLSMDNNISILRLVMCVHVFRAFNGVTGVV